MIYCVIEMNYVVYMVCL